MNLPKSLKLTGVRTEEVSFFPTSEFFKPVVAITASFDKSVAQVLQCDWVFDRSGNPNPFEGSVKLHGELSGPRLTFRMAEQNLGVGVTAALIGHLSIRKIEKIGLRLAFRVHLPEQRESTDELLKTLAMFNKESYELTIDDSQPTLAFGGSDETPAGTDKYDISVQCGKGGFVFAEITFAERAKDNWVAGWQVKANGLKSQAAGGRLINDESDIFDSKAEAVDWAANEIFEFVATLEVSGKKEQDAIERISAFAANHVLQPVQTTITQ